MSKEDRTDPEEDGVVSGTRVIKTIGYRISASLLAQLVSWVLFGSIIVNVGVLVADLTQMVWYYLYDTIFSAVKED